jgi:mono/diheme cytochrome c family protein
MTRGAKVLGGVVAVMLAALTTPARAESDAALAARGKQLFVEHGCHGCHTVGKMGTPIATDLTHVGARYPRTRLEEWLRDPAAQRPTAHMPRIRLKGGEIMALAAYLAALR